MLIVTLQDAKARLSELVARAVKGEPFAISTAGNTVVRVEAIAPANPLPPTIDEAQQDSPTRWGLGTLQGQFTVPDDFDTMARDEIEAIFNGKP